VEAELHEGGSYRINLSKSSTPAFSIYGEYLEIARPKKISFSYHYKGLQNAPPPSVITISLQELSNKTTSMNFVQKFELEPADFETRSRTWNYMFELLSNFISGETETQRKQTN